MAVCISFAAVCLHLPIFLLLIICVNANVYFQDQGDYNVIASDSSREQMPASCQCRVKTHDCGCCLHLDISEIGLNDTGCVNVSYLPEVYGISFTFSINDHIIVNETVSARNPPPICFAVPGLKSEASLCIEFYKLDVTRQSFSGCIRLTARLYRVFVERVELGCFRVPLRRTTFFQMTRRNDRNPNNIIL